MKFSLRVLLSFIMITCGACQQTHYLSTGSQLDAQDPLGLTSSSNPPPFVYYTMSTAEKLGQTNSGTVALYNQKEVDPNNNYNPATGTFTAPENNYYHFVVSFGVAGPWGTDAKCGVELMLSASSEPVKESIEDLTTNDTCDENLDFYAPMQQGETAQIFFLNTDASKTVDTDQGVTEFEVTWSN
jgi:hypothetical protein